MIIEFILLWQLTLNYISIHEFSISGIEWTIMLYIMILIILPRICTYDTE